VHTSVRPSGRNDTRNGGPHGYDSSFDRSAFSQGYTLNNGGQDTVEDEAEKFESKEMQQDPVTAVSTTRAW
jgi:hypothetical protein